MRSVIVTVSSKGKFLQLVKFVFRQVNDHNFTLPNEILSNCVYHNMDL